MNTQDLNEIHYSDLINVLSFYRDWCNVLLWLMFYKCNKPPDAVHSSDFLMVNMGFSDSVLF